MVEGGAKCMRFLFFWCLPCGKGSRCISCDWCTGFCFNSMPGRSPADVEYGSVEAPYKIPFLDMFIDIEALLKSDGIPDQDLVDLYNEISVVTREDCTICNNSPELNDLSIFTDKVHEEPKNIIGTVQFKTKAIELTTETKNKVENLPDSLKIKVESTSSLLESVPTTSTWTTTTSTTKTTTTTTEACLASGAQCMVMSTFAIIGNCCPGLTCDVPGAGGTCQ